MENASKALLIAGGVLIALLVISLGMYIIGRAQNTAVSAEERRLQTLVQEQINKFSQYSGNIYGAEVENCIRRVYSYNKGKAEDEKIMVYVKQKDGERILGSTARFPIDSDIIDETNSDIKNNFKPDERNDIYSGTITYKINGMIETISFE